MKRPTVLSVLGAAALALSAARADAGTIRDRQERQQQRIARGIASGQLTAREAARLEWREANLNRRIGAMRRANGGPLTPSQRALVRRRQNRLSRAIYRQRHNAARR